MQLLYDLLQIPPCPKWNVFKRIKSYFSVRKMKKSISEDIHNWGSFFENVIDYCIFMEHVSQNFQVPKNDNYDCKIIMYNTLLTTYILRFKTLYNNKECQTTIIYKTDETDRLNVKMKIDLGISEVGYDVYLESDKMESYRYDDLKKDIIDFTIDYIDTEINRTLDNIASKYIFRRKDNSDEKEEI